jgi:hypothetical protein
LKNSRFNLGIGQEVHDKLDVHVGDTNVTSKTGINKLLELGPQLMERRTLKFNLVSSGLVPSRRVSSLNSNMLERNRD